MMKKQTEEAAYHIGHQAASRDALLPLPLNLENSERNAIATGRSIPTPRPMTKRAQISTYTLGARPAAIAAITKKSISAMKTWYRPILSVNQPPARLPRMVPTMMEDVTKPVTVGVK